MLGTFDNEINTAKISSYQCSLPSKDTIRNIEKRANSQMIINSKKIVLQILRVIKIMEQTLNKSQQLQFETQAQ
jgi:hypothetical protein